VCFIFEVFAAVSELTKRCFGEELGSVAESFFGVICLKRYVKLRVREKVRTTYLVANGAPPWLYAVS
jgi:hypothetical protein